MRRSLVRMFVIGVLALVGVGVVSVAQSAPAQALTCSYTIVESASANSTNGAYTLQVYLYTDSYIFNHQRVYCHDYYALSFICSAPSTVGGTLYAYLNGTQAGTHVHYSGGGANGSCSGAGKTGVETFTVSGTGCYWGWGNFYADDFSASVATGTNTFCPPN